jgi:hypothetical protein
MSESKLPLILVVADFQGARHLDFVYMEDRFKREVFNMAELDLEIPNHEMIRFGMSNVNDLPKIDTNAYSDVHVLIVSTGILLEPLINAAKHMVNVYTHDTLPGHYDFEKVVYEN